MEVLVAGELKYEALFPAITASFAASMTSKALGLTKFTFAISYDFSLSGMFLIKLVLLGVIFGFVGGAICMELKRVKQRMSNKIQDPIVRIVLIGIALSCFFLLLYGRPLFRTGNQFN